MNCIPDQYFSLESMAPVGQTVDCNSTVSVFAFQRNTESRSAVFLGFPWFAVGSNRSTLTQLVSFPGYVGGEKVASYPLLVHVLAYPEKPGNPCTTIYCKWSAMYIWFTWLPYCQEMAASEEAFSHHCIGYLDLSWTCFLSITSLCLSVSIHEWQLCLVSHWHCQQGIRSISCRWTGQFCCNPTSLKKAVECLGHTFHRKLCR